MRLYGLSNCNDNISETISLGEVLCQYIRLGTATTCRQKLSIGGALDSMREQWMANSATAPLSASSLPVLNECIDLDYVRPIFHMIYVLIIVASILTCVASKGKPRNGANTAQSFSRYSSAYYRE